MTPEFPEPFAQYYDCLLKRMKLHGMQPKTIALYSHGVRRAGGVFHLSNRRADPRSIDGLFCACGRAIIVEHAPAQFVWFEVLLRTCIAKTLARCGSGEAAQNIKTARYRHGGTGAADF